MPDTSGEDMSFEKFQHHSHSARFVTLLTLVITLLVALITFGIFGKGNHEASIPHDTAPPSNTPSEQ